MSDKTRKVGRPRNGWIKRGILVSPEMDQWLAKWKSDGLTRSDCINQALLLFRYHKLRNEYIEKMLRLARNNHRIPDSVRKKYDEYEAKYLDTANRTK